MDGDDAIKALAERIDAYLGRGVAHGQVTVAIPTINVGGNVTVTFPVGRFTANPHVVATAMGPSPQNYSPIVLPSTPTATSCGLRVARIAGSPGDMELHWLAIQ
jgi:hypothetical protein